MGLIGSSVAKEVGQTRLEKANVTILLTFPKFIIPVDADGVWIWKGNKTKP